VRLWANYCGVHHWDVADLVPPARPRLSGSALKRLLPLALAKHEQALELIRHRTPLPVIARALDYPRADFLRESAFVCLDDYELIIRSFQSPLDVDHTLRARGRPRRHRGFIRASDVSPGKPWVSRPVTPVNG
jgi:hypothetical protein